MISRAISALNELQSLIYREVETNFSVGTNVVKFKNSVLRRKTIYYIPLTSDVDPHWSNADPNPDPDPGQ